MVGVFFIGIFFLGLFFLRVRLFGMGRIGLRHVNCLVYP